MLGSWSHWCFLLSSLTYSFLADRSSSLYWLITDSSSLVNSSLGEGMFIYS